ncbi:MAG: 30S ribosomal protein S20 [Verrucomicrobiota bacterium]
MANIKANKKSIRQSARRAEHNKSVRTRLKSLVKSFASASFSHSDTLPANRRGKIGGCRLP